MYLTGDGGGKFVSFCCDVRMSSSAAAADGGFDIRLRPGFTLLMVAPSTGGKTYYCYRLLMEINELAVSPVTRLGIFFKVHQPIYDRMRQDLPFPVELFNELPTEEVVRPRAEREQESGGSYCLVVDDFGAAGVNQYMVDYARVHSHHYNSPLICLVQTLFAKSPLYREFTLNMRYYVVFPNPRDKSGFLYLARQLSPSHWRAVVGIFEAITSVPFNPMWIDMTQECPPELRYRSHMLRSDIPRGVQVWVPNK